MAVSQFCACVWTVAGLLLVLLLCHSPASALPPCERWSQFHRITETLKLKLKDCHQDCNSTQIVDRKCKCLNLNASENCVFPDYLFSGLEAMNRTLPEGSSNINGLIQKLSITHIQCKLPKDQLNLSCKNSISPKSFLETLTNVAEWIKSSQTNNHT